MNRLVVLHKRNRANLINNLSPINLGYLTTVILCDSLKSVWDE
jgi:hypothetical protein